MTDLRELFEEETGEVDYPPVDYPSADMVQGYEFSYWKNYAKWLEKLVSTQAEELENIEAVWKEKLRQSKAMYDRLQSKYESLLRRVEGAEKKSLFRDCNGDLFIADSLNDNDWHILNRFWFKDIESDGDELAVALVPMPLKEGDES